MNMIMNFRLAYSAGTQELGEQLLASEEGLSPAYTANSTRANNL